MTKCRAFLKWLFVPAHALPLCLAAGFLLPTNAAWSTFFYILGFPTILWRLWQGWRPDWSNRPAMAMLVLWGWSSLTILWELNNSHQGDGRGYWLLCAASTLALLLGFWMAMQDDPQSRERVITVIIWSGAAAATLSIGLYVGRHQWGQRLGGWGTLHMAVLAAAVMVVCIFLTLRHALAGRKVYWAALLPMLVYLPLNGSRTALLALLGGLVVLAAGSRKALAWLLGCGLAVLALCYIIYSLHFGWVDDYIKAAMARGTDCHITIWRTAWGMFLQHPVLGYGPSARLLILPHGYCPAYPSPHNLYLSLLVYSGLVGFGLFWCCQALVVRHVCCVVRGQEKRFALAVMLVPLITGLSDLTQIIKGPSPLWYIIWLPLLLAASLPRSIHSFPASSALPPRG